MSSGPALLADEMLGKLARELRALGYDAAYARGASDDRILERARAEERILLTRDIALAEGADVPVVALESRDPSEQLGRVLAELGLTPTPGAFLSRCLECNEGLEPTEDIEDVPDDVREGPHSRCPACDRVYWPGTHARDMLERLREHLEAPVDDEQALDPTADGASGERKP